MKKLYLAIIGVIVAGATLFVATRVMAKNPSSSNAVNSSANPTPANKLHTNINEGLAISLPGKGLKKLTYTIESADLTNDIIVNGQRIQSTNGKIFLVLNIKINNDNPQGIQINSRDYVRLAAGTNSNEWWAPEIYNDPIEAQAISTKLGRLGFTVDNKQKEFKLRIGEISGDKRDIIVKF